MDKRNRKLYLWAGVDLDMGANFLEAMSDLTESLDACFKWLVPKLGKVIIQLDNKFKLWYCSLVMEDMQDRMFVEKAETPALALCKAIEQLIDKES